MPGETVHHSEMQKPQPPDSLPAEPADPPSPTKPNKWLLAASVMCAKSLMATTRRSLFLYVAFEADAAGVSDQRILTVLAAMNLISGISPLLTPLFLVLLNHVQLIWLTIFLSSSAQLSMDLSTSFSVFVPAASASAIGFGRGLFDPVVSSLYASALPAEERAKVSSVVELAWGLSSFIGVPLYGLVMGVDGSAPHFMLAILLMFSALPFTRLKVEKQQTSEESSTCGMPDKVHTCCGRYAQLRHRKDAKRVLTMTLALFATQFGGELLAVCFGLWLVRVQGLAVEFVATATLIIGVADLLAEVLVTVCISWKGYDAFGFTRIAVGANILGFASRNASRNASRHHRLYSPVAGIRMLLHWPYWLYRTDCRYPEWRCCRKYM